MALKDRLGDLSQQIAAEKQAEAKIQRDEQLAPTRANIKKLEKEKLDLEMIKNSLDFKNERDPKNNQGMEDYAESTGAGVKKTHDQLEQIAADNPEALKELSIESVEELVASPEFSEEEEVVVYKKAADQQEGLFLSDTKLKNRLAKLGVDMKDEDFSYETASQEIGRHLENLNNELLSERLKTPEGKEKVVEDLVEEFSKNTENLFWEGSFTVDKEAQRRGSGSNTENSYYEFAFKANESSHGDSFRVEFIDDKLKISNYYNLPILPKNFKEQADKYGDEITAEALKQSYDEKVNNAFMAANAPLGEATRQRSLIESFSPEKQKLAEQALRNFDLKKKEVLDLLRTKSEELKAKGIEFDPEKASGYGIKYDSLFQFGNKSHGPELKNAEDIINTFHTGGYNHNKLYPNYNYDKLVDVAERRINELDQAIGVINGIVDKESVNKFLGEDDANISNGVYSRRVYYKECPINKLHHQLLDNKFQEEAKFEYAEYVDYKELEELSSKFKSYAEASQYLDKEIAEAENIEKKVAEKVAEVVDYRVTEHNIRNLDKAYLNLSPDSLRDMVKGVEYEREDAKKIMVAIAELQARLPQEEDLRVKGSNVTVPGKEIEYTALGQDINKKQNELKSAKAALSEKQKLEPWLGKDAWRKKVEELRKEVDKVEVDISELKEKYELARSKSSYYLRFDDNNMVPWNKLKKIIETYSATGKANEIFEDLKKKLIILVDKEPMIDLKNRLDKFDDLGARLQGRK